MLHKYKILCIKKGLTTYTILKILFIRKILIRKNLNKFKGELNEANK